MSLTDAVLDDGSGPPRLRSRTVRQTISYEAKGHGGRDLADPAGNGSDGRGPMTDGVEGPGSDPRTDDAIRDLARDLVVETRSEPTLVPEGIFRRAIHVERSRADRSGSPLAVVLLITQPSTAVSAADSLLAELRGGDSVSILRSGHVAALLPCTGRAGAEAVVERVLERMSSPPGYQMVVYPEDAWAEVTHAKIDPRFLPEPRAVDEELYPAEKRITDVLLASLAILVTSPVLLLLALWIKLVSPGPILFRQKRVGLGGRHFEMLKFRTMHVDTGVVDTHREHSTSFIKNEGAMPKARLPLIPGGWLIRGFCLDELPQFFNVIKGEMSVVGPRPCIPYEAAEYKQWHYRRFAAMPGITGLWQVSGKNRLSFSQMVRLDLRYAQKVSWHSDMIILLKTGPAIVREFFLSVTRRQAT